ncbi:MAG: DUF707 domain-containing protein [Promethearchaeota archaeon]
MNLTILIRIYYKTYYNSYKDSMKRRKKKLMKYLFTSSVEKCCKKSLKRIIKRFGYEDFDYIIYGYDDTEFNEKIFKYCNFIYEKEKSEWDVLGKSITPEICKKYDYIFMWISDIDLNNFSYKNFINIMKHNNLEIAQPALSYKSYYNYLITLKNKNYKIGRLTDFVEAMVPVFSKDAYIKFWKIIIEDLFLDTYRKSHFYWGFDILAKSICEYKKMGIIDCETVTNTKLIQSHKSEELLDIEKFFKKYSSYKHSEQIIYGSLK